MRAKQICGFFYIGASATKSWGKSKLFRYGLLLVFFSKRKNTAGGGRTAVFDYFFPINPLCVISLYILENDAIFQRDRIVILVLP